MSSRPCIGCNETVTKRRPNGEFYERCYNCNEHFKLHSKKCSACYTAPIKPQYEVCFTCSRRAAPAAHSSAQEVFDTL